MAVPAPEPPHDEVVRLYAEGWTLLQLGTRFRVAPTRIRAILRSEDVEIRRHGPNGRPPRRGPEPPHDELVRLYVKDWWSLARLADRYQIGAMRVRGILLSEGVGIRSCGEQAPQPRRGPEPPHGDLVRLYVEDRWSLARLAERYCITSVRVRGILLSHDLTIRRAGGQVPKPRRGPEPLHDEAVRLYQAGWSVNRLCERFRIGPRRLRDILTSHGVTIRGLDKRPPPPNRGPEPPHGELVRLYVEDLWSLRGLAERYQVGPRRVRGILFSEGVAIRGPGPRGPSPKRGPEPPHAELLGRYVEDGWTLHRLAKHYGIGTPRVRAILGDAGITIRRGGHPPTGPNAKRRIHVPPEQAKVIAERYQAGASLAAIGIATWLSPPVVRRVLIDQGIPIRPRSGTRTPPAVDPDQLIGHYQAGNTLTGTAKKFGKSVYWVRKLLTAAGVEIRRHGGASHPASLMKRASGGSRRSEKGGST